MNTRTAGDDRDRIERDFRVPVMSYRHCDAWIGCLTEDSEVPTDTELRMIRSWIEYRVLVGISYRGHWQKIMLGDVTLPDDYDRNQHLARDRGMARNEFSKVDGSWAYQRSTWTLTGRWPLRKQGDPPTTLIELLDRLHDNVDDARTNEERAADVPYRSRPKETWQQWKADHPDVFAAASASVGS